MRDIFLYDNLTGRIDELIEEPTYYKSPNSQRSTGSISRFTANSLFSLSCAWRKGTNAKPEPQAILNLLTKVERAASKSLPLFPTVLQKRESPLIVHYMATEIQSQHLFLFPEKPISFLPCPDQRGFCSL